jgi:hypothetical protein
MTDTKLVKAAVGYEAPKMIDVGEIVKVTRAYNENVRDNPGGIQLCYQDPKIDRLGAEFIDIPSE